MNLLIFLTHPEPTRSGYEKYLAPRHPELKITTVGTRDEALKLAPEADILMAFGPQARKDFFQHTPKLKWVFSLGTGTDGITDSPYLGKGWPLWRVPPLPIVFTLRLGQRFAPTQDSDVLQAELEQYFRQNMEQRATDASPECQTPRAPTLS